MKLPTAITEAIAELELYADTEEAEAARVLAHLLADSDDVDASEWLSLELVPGQLRWTGVF